MYHKTGLILNIPEATILASAFLWRSERMKCSMLGDCLNVSLLTHFKWFTFCQVLFLNLFTDVDAVRMPVLRSLQPVSLELKKFSHNFPELFYKVRQLRIQSFVFTFCRTVYLP